MNIHSKINKMLKALEIKGHIYFLSKESFYSNKIKKVCSVYKLFTLISVEEYNKLHPLKPKDTTKYKLVQMEVYSSFILIDILKKLVNIYARVGEANEE